MERGASNWANRSARDAVLAGDAAAWRSLYLAHFDRLADYARWRCGGLADLADDVVQETWLAAVRRLRDFDPDRGPFLAWLCGIAANAARNAVRGRLRKLARSRSLVPGDDRATPAPDGAAEKAEAVAVALDELPDHYEAVLRAKYLDGLSVEQIAASRGETESVVASLLNRARQAFRDAYRKAADE